MEPTQKQVNFHVWDLDTGEVEELCMDEETYREWEEMEQRMEFERHERRENARRRDMEAMYYDRD